MFHVRCGCLDTEVKRDVAWRRRPHFFLKVDVMEQLDQSMLVPTTKGTIHVSSSNAHRMASVCLVGGRRIIREALAQLLSSHGYGIAEKFEQQEHLSAALDSGVPSWDVIVMIINEGPFKIFYGIRDLLERCVESSVVVVADVVSRGQVYAAMRAGIKAYVNFDADSSELIKAIEMATQKKVFLSSDAAALLVDDLSRDKTSGHPPRPVNPELSDREQEIVQLMCEGLSSKEIGRRLHISCKTVENHRYNIYRKAGVESLAGLIRYAIQHGLFSL